MRLSLYLSFRDQHAEFERMLKSVQETAMDKRSIEVLAVVDDDDTETLLKKQSYEAKYADINLKVLVTGKSNHFIRDYYNYAERNAVGRFLISVSADALFITPCWDYEIYTAMKKAAERFGDDILYGMIDDELHWSEQEGFSSWAVTSKEYVNLMGGSMPGEIMMWGADVALGKIFDKIDEGKRKVNLRHVKIKHLSHHIDKTIEVTPNAARFEKLKNRTPAFLTEDQIAEKAEKVNKYIHEKSLLQRV